MIKLFFVLLIIALVAFFSVQNASPTVITFLFWRFEASLAIVIFLSALAGVLVMSIVFSSRAVRRYFKEHRSEHKTQTPS